MLCLAGCGLRGGGGGGGGGGDSFDYTISDGHGGSDTATVHVTVTSATTVVGAFVIGEYPPAHRPSAEM